MAHDSEVRALELIESYARGMLDLPTMVTALKGQDWGGQDSSRSTDLATAWVEAADLQSSGTGGSLVGALATAKGRGAIDAKQANEIYAAYQA